MATIPVSSSSAGSRYRQRRADKDGSVLRPNGGSGSAFTPSFGAASDYAGRDSVRVRFVSGSIFCRIQVYFRSILEQTRPAIAFGTT